MILINGVEYNILDNHHASLLMPGGADGMPFLNEFLNRFDVSVAGNISTEERFLEGLRFLSQRDEGDCCPAVFFNHPKKQGPRYHELLHAAFECGPSVLGLCASSRPPARGDREVWPWVSEIGGLNDQLLCRGRRTVMVAESHIHRHDIAKGGVEFWPGEFRRTYVYCPERTEAGFFAGLRSGASYFVLGGIVENVDFKASVDGRSAMIGERLAVSTGSPVTVSVEFVEHARLESVELIGNPGGDVRIVASSQGEALEHSAEMARWTVEMQMPPKPFFLRLRGSAPIEKPYPVMAWFYTTPLWIVPAA